MKSTKFVWLGILVILTLILSSCGGEATPTTAPAAAPLTLQVRRCC